VPDPPGAIATILSLILETSSQAAPLHTLLSRAHCGAQTRAALRGGGPTMGVTVTTTSPGDGKNFPKKGDTLQMHYKVQLRCDGPRRIAHLVSSNFARMLVVAHAKSRPSAFSDRGP